MSGLAPTSPARLTDLQFERRGLRFALRGRLEKSVRLALFGTKSAGSPFRTQAVLDRADRCLCPEGPALKLKTGLKLKIDDDLASRSRAQSSSEGHGSRAEARPGGKHHDDDVSSATAA
eukprot:691233-Rhodomonas_salina.1